MSLPEVTLSAPTEAGQAESAIPVLKQWFYIGRKPVIPSTLAGTLCAELGVNGVLEKLNVTLGTSYNLIASLNSVLESYITQNDDFSMAYVHLRCYWSDYIWKLQTQYIDVYRALPHIPCTPLYSAS